jgi:predicted metalloprotease with PDZ domain
MNWASSILRRNVAVSGHRVLYVNEAGPGASAGLVPYLDIITAVEGAPLNDSDNTLGMAISKWLNKKTELTVFNVKTGGTRKTSIVRVTTCGDRIKP